MHLQHVPQAGAVDDAQRLVRVHPTGGPGAGDCYLARLRDERTKVTESVNLLVMAGLWRHIKCLISKPECTMTSKQKSFNKVTVNAVEDLAFHAYLDAVQKAFAFDGMVGVLQLGGYALNEFDKVAADAAKQGHDDSNALGIACSFLANDYLPNMLKGMTEHGGSKK